MLTQVSASTLTCFDQTVVKTFQRNTREAVPGALGGAPIEP